MRHTDEKGTQMTKAHHALASLLAVGVVVALTATPALAVRGHVFKTSFGSQGAGDGQFEEPSGVAVNEASGDVYVIDAHNDRVEYLSSAGAYLGQFNGQEIDGLPAGLGKEAPSKFSFGRPRAFARRNRGVGYRCR